MIAAQAIRETRMNKVKLLKTASAMRHGRTKAAESCAASGFLPKMAGLAASFETGLAKLRPEERSHLLLSLKQLLERERRRCRARAGRYDAGRHISLYMAVKTLMADKSPGA